MIRYVKGPAPQELGEVAATPGADWAGGFHGRASVREALVRDQRGLCAYCQRRIKPDESMHIEHWIPRSDPDQGREAQFRWSNLLGVCPGVTEDWDDRDRTRVRHCDTSRGDTRLFLQPVEGPGPDPRTHLVYNANGVISARNDDARVTKDIETLNLSASILERGRAQALDGFRRLAAQQNYDAGYLKRRLTDYEQRALAPEYFEVIRAYILRKLRQAAARN